MSATNCKNVNSVRNVGPFTLMCSCGVVHVQLMMDGEHGEYRPLATKANLLIVQHYENGIKLRSYDNACGEISWEKEALKRAVGASLMTAEEASKLAVVQFVPKLHAPAHCYLCQLMRGQLHVPGAGYSNYENLEQYHDIIGGVKCKLRHSSLVHYANTMHRMNLRLADDTNRNFPVWVVRRMQKVGDVIRKKYWFFTVLTQCPFRCSCSSCVLKCGSACAAAVFGCNWETSSRRVLFRGM